VDQVSPDLFARTDNRHPVADPFVLCMKGKLIIFTLPMVKLIISCHFTQSRYSIREEVEE
jgi:hypothetical protein